MTRKLIYILIFFLPVLPVTAQSPSYKKTLGDFQKKYVKEHEVVKKPERKYFRFFPIDQKYNIQAHFEKIADTSAVSLRTSSNKNKTYDKYGILTFTLDGAEVHLALFQSRQLLKDEKYKNYLFLPFADLTSGEECYGGGRYLDLSIEDIKDGKLWIDFNKAYNPYCAYATGFNCPIPPAENNLPIAIRAGEMNFAKEH